MEIMIVVAIIGLLASIAIPNFVKARETSQMNACINNLRMIDSGKEQATLAERWADDALVVTTIVSFLPTRRIAKLKPTDALRGRLS